MVDIEFPGKIKGRVHQDGRLIGVAGPVEDVGQADECNILLVAVRTVSFTVITVSLTVMTTNTATATLCFMKQVLAYTQIFVYQQH